MGLPRCVPIIRVRAMLLFAFEIYAHCGEMIIKEFILRLWKFV